MPDVLVVSAVNPGKELETQSFPRAARLLRAGDYSRVFAKPTRSRDAMFTVLARGCEGSSARLGLAVSKKVARRAVDRNRIKRQIREAFRQSSAAHSGLDIVVVARPGAAKGCNEELRNSLADHWRRLARKGAVGGAAPVARQGRGRAV